MFLKLIFGIVLFPGFQIDPDLEEVMHPFCVTVTALHFTLKACLKWSNLNNKKTRHIAAFVNSLFCGVRWASADLLTKLNDFLCATVNYTFWKQRFSIWELQHFVAFPCISSVRSPWEAISVDPEWLIYIPWKRMQNKWFPTLLI